MSAVITWQSGGCLIDIHFDDVARQWRWHCISHGDNESGFADGGAAGYAAEVHAGTESNGPTGGAS